MSDLVLYGPLRPDFPTRIDRALDHSLLDAVNRGRYVNLTGGRQKGKTTTLLWLRQALLDQGAASAYVDLSPLGETESSPEDWIRLVASSVNDSLMPSVLRGRSAPLASDFPALQAFFVDVAVASPQRPAVLIFDEVSAVPDEFRRPFFYGIRALYNMRSDVGRPDGVEQLLFVFGGSFDPDRLIPETPNSPFNVAETIAVSDFDYGIAETRSTLALAGSHLDPESVLDLTAGHPYLTNLVASLRPAPRAADIPGLLLARGDLNLAYVARTLRESPALRMVACRIAAGEEVPYVPGIDPALADLAVLGLIKPDGGNRACISGRLYLEVLRHLCADIHATGEPARPRAGPLDFVAPDGFRRHLETLLSFADESAARYPALGAACVGAVVEGALLAALEQRDDLPALAESLNREIQEGRVDGGLKFQSPDLPVDRWTLAQMIEVARICGMVSKPSSQVSHGIRGWRNLVHPAEMRKTYPDGVPADVAEASVASGHLLLREIGDAVTRGRT